MNSGQFRPGQSGNPNGKPKGAQEHATRRIRLWLDKFLDDKTELIEEDIMALKPKDRLFVILGLMEFSVPKLQRVEQSGEMDVHLHKGIPVTEWGKDGNNPEPEV